MIPLPLPLLPTFFPDNFFFVKYTGDSLSEITRHQMDDTRIEERNVDYTRSTLRRIKLAHDPRFNVISS